MEARERSVNESDEMVKRAWWVTGEQKWASRTSRLGWKHLWGKNYKTKSAKIGVDKLFSESSERNQPDKERHSRERRQRRPACLLQEALWTTRCP